MLRTIVMFALATTSACTASRPAPRGVEPTTRAAAAAFTRTIPWIGRGVWIDGDTHVHSTFSDGNHPIDVVAARARENGCRFLALTDHATKELRRRLPDYLASVAAARRASPEMLVFGGIEWNPPPHRGTEHATVLVAPEDEEILGPFIDRFDDVGSPAVEPVPHALAWLGSTPRRPAVVHLNHPLQRGRSEDAVMETLGAMAAAGGAFAGFSGAPGHQEDESPGKYTDPSKVIDRWDAIAARPGGVWDRLLAQGHDVWGAVAPSDFHDDAAPIGDRWPCGFSVTTVYAPSASYEGVLEALRAGAAFGSHGKIATKASLEVATKDLPRPAWSGEVIEAEPGALLRVQLRVAGSTVEAVEVVVVEASGVHTLSAKPNTEVEVRVPSAGVVLRARGRATSGHQLYVNPVRVVTRQAS